MAFALNHLLKKPLSLVNTVCVSLLPYGNVNFHITCVLSLSTLRKDGERTFIYSLSCAVDGCGKQLFGNGWSQHTVLKVFLYFHTVCVSFPHYTGILETIR